ncbi:hypothetical protein EDD16DRAFT_1892797 [Pisolithus croceorrhizus]|nr:hypothetical protein EV401DRAFT_2235537 [Pisolithus croceorrhizus]KAI6127924.1 hypothetical protein EDD16DRAFT_1892797 [Pisolithus croceorrhizus]KAI6158532.1 hypothetical protein EDD17DRAFT_1736798 [Pisolithus thermaeus]
MHPCLRIAEILDLIISFMVDERIHKPGEVCGIRHQDIERLARTCKAFRDPALDVLWRTQPSLSPLIMCLPNHLWTVKEEHPDWVVTLQKGPSPEDWLSLQKYSHRIRSFNYCSRRQLPVCQSTIDTVFSPNLSQELFPCLRTLNLEVIGCGLVFPSLRAIPLLNSVSLPQLVRLTFAISHTNLFGDPYLYFKPACAPSLQVLSINVRSGRLDPLVVNFAEFPSLRSLYLSDVPSGGGWEWIHLHYLRDLTVTLPNGFDIDADSSTQPILPSLRRLDLRVGTLYPVTKLLSSTASSDLDSVKVFCRSPAPLSDTYALFRAIERVHECSPNLGTLDVHCSYPATPSPIHPSTFNGPSYDLPRSTLALLLVCRHLRVLRLSFTGTLDIDDAFVTKIALSWPCIEILHLYGSSQDTPRVSLEGIHELLRRCQKLSSLAIQTDARIVPEEEPQTRSLSLEALDIDCFHIADELALVEYLGILAPKLKSLMLPGPRGFPDIRY